MPWKTHTVYNNASATAHVRNNVDSTPTAWRKYSPNTNTFRGKKPEHH